MHARMRTIDEIHAIPSGVSFEFAGAVPLAGLTAGQALFDDGGLERGQMVLVHGGSGGVGHVAIQLAKHAGARVIATASAASRDVVLGFGMEMHSIGPGRC
jgi:NADPH:quinone reductase-like Zn-dependent oxidoreductase